MTSIEGGSDKEAPDTSNGVRCWQLRTHTSADTRDGKRGQTSRVEINQQQRAAYAVGHFRLSRPVPPQWVIVCYSSGTAKLAQYARLQPSRQCRPSQLPCDE